MLQQYCTCGITSPSRHQRSSKTNVGSAYIWPNRSSFSMRDGNISPLVTNVVPVPAPVPQFAHVVGDLIDLNGAVKYPKVPKNTRKSKMMQTSKSQEFFVEPMLYENPGCYSLSTPELHSKPQVPRLLPIQFSTESVNKVTFFIMSILVAIFINIPFGVAAVLVSQKSHSLLMASKSARTCASMGTTSELLREKAEKVGKLAFALNILGILSTMILVIVVCQIPPIAPAKSKT